MTKVSWTCFLYLAAQVAGKRVDIEKITMAEANDELPGTPPQVMDVSDDSLPRSPLSMSDSEVAALRASMDTPTNTSAASFLQIDKYEFVAGCNGTNSFAKCRGGQWCVTNSHKYRGTWQDCATRCQGLDGCKGFAWRSSPYKGRDQAVFDKLSWCMPCMQNLAGKGVSENWGIWKRNQVERARFVRPDGEAGALRTEARDALQFVYQDNGKQAAVYHDEVVDVLEKTTSWARVKSKEGTGWVRNAYLRKVDSNTRDVQRAPSPKESLEAPEQQRVVRSDYCSADWSCSAKNSWARGDFLMKGSYGKVYKVQLAGAGGTYAMKYPVSGQERPTQAECQDIREEAEMITEIQRDMQGKRPECANTFMRVRDVQPCLHDAWAPKPTAAKGAYVMDLMDGDLNHWLKHYSSSKSSCAAHIAALAEEALACFHEAGWVHSDVKLANFLYKGVSPTRDRQCPIEIRLADFGLSGKINSRRDMFGKDDYDGCWYLPSDMFYLKYSNYRTYKLGGVALQRRAQFVRKPSIDWCSYHFAMKTSFGYDASALAAKHWSGECGPMGSGRRTNYTISR